MGFIKPNAWDLSLFWMRHLFVQLEKDFSNFTFWKMLRFYCSMFKRHLYNSIYLHKYYFFLFQDTATINITILDLNDNKPIFQNSTYKFTIPEGKHNKHYYCIYNL